MSLERAVDQQRFHRYFPVERETDALDAMNEAMRSISGAYAVVLSTLDGQRLAFVTDTETNTSRLAAMIGSLCALGETLGKELNMEEFRDVMVQMGNGIAVIQRIKGQRLVLMTAVGAGANMGLVSSHTRYCNEAIGQMCFVGRD